MTGRPVDDLLAEGQAALDPALADHIAAGAGDDSTVAANRLAIDAMRLVPRVAVGVGTPSTEVELFGRRLASPVLTAPVGPLELIDPAGASAVASATRAADTGTITAVTSGPVLEEVASHAGTMLFQLYWWGDRDWVESMVRRSEAAGCAALVVTVDVPDYGRRWRDMRSGFDHHGQMGLPNLADAPPDRADRLAYQAAVSWEDIAWLCSLTELPVIVKGVLSAVDGHRAVEAGAGGVYVSNHGGRALAGQLGSLVALDEVTQAVGGEVPIIVDGGFRTAEDIAKGLALGADVVALGRAACWALAAGGEESLRSYLQQLTDDLRIALTVLGARSPAELTRHHIR